MSNVNQLLVERGMHPAQVVMLYSDLPDYYRPDIIEFVCSDAYLDRGNLYPRQGTLLKIMFLQDELFTEYDYEVIGQWEKMYLDTVDDNGEARGGIVPGVLDRIKINKAQGRQWFREVVAPIGRRGSKGHVGAMAVAYVLWSYIAHADPQSHYGVDKDKRLTCFVFAGKREQAKANQWRDINNVILGAPIFDLYISRAQAESLTIRSRQDLRRLKAREKRELRLDQDDASFEIIPKESTELAGRGPASFCQVYDEMAHVVAAVAKADASSVYESATPALDQFGKDAFIYLPSSPWQRIGKFYEKYLQAVEFETGEDGLKHPVYPELMMIQLASWDIYEDWDIAHTIPRVPGGLPYEKLIGPIQTYDDQMKQLERANIDTFRVERRSWFAAVLDAYLSPERIAEMWLPWPDPDRDWNFQTRGILSRSYRAHGDPSKSGAQFGFAIAHTEGPDDRGLPHVVFDLIHHWDPADFPDYTIDYDEIGTEIIGYMDAFMPASITFDQFNSVSTIQRLQKHARSKNYPKQVMVSERTANHALNWKTWETFKTALGLGLVHAPFYDWANQELTFLQDLGGKVECPTAGPVQTKDVADCIAIVVYELIGAEMAAYIGESLSSLPLGAHPGIDPYAKQKEQEVFDQFSQFGRGKSSGLWRR